MPATTEKPHTLARELVTLERMTAAELRDKYAAVFGEPAEYGNCAWISRCVGWRLRALAKARSCYAWGSCLSLPDMGSTN